jgi:hypothetical protein
MNRFEKILFDAVQENEEKDEWDTYPPELQRELCFRHGIIWQMCHGSKTELNKETVQGELFK